MHVTRLRAENLKRLKAVDIKFDPDMPEVIIKGKNAAGKSSILDAIWFALGGGRTFSDQEVIREGEEGALAEVTIGDFRVTRKWSEKGSSLTVRDAEGREYTSPQSMLDKFAEAFMFDPLQFLEMHPSDQKAKLLEVSGHAEELEALDDEHDEVYQERRDINREVRKLKSQLEALDDVDTDLADEDVPKTSDLVSELQEAKSAKSTKEDLLSDAEANRSQAETLREKADKLDEEADEWEDEASGIDVPDIEALETRVEEADERREAVENAKEKVTLQEQYEEQEAASEEKTERLDEIEEEKASIIADADLPEGIGFEDDGVTFNGRPLASASMSEKLGVAMSVAMHMDPDLKIIQLRDASLLDDESRKKVIDMADDFGFQVFLEMVGTDGPATILIEDGEVVEDFSG